MMTLNPFNFDTTPGIRFGSGQAKDSCKEIFKKLGSRILFITDKGLMSLGLTKPTIEELKKMGSVEVFDNVGALLYSTQRSVGGTVIQSFKEYDSGIYTLQVTNNKVQYMQKIIVTK